MWNEDEFQMDWEGNEFLWESEIRDPEVFSIHFEDDKEEIGNQIEHPGGSKRLFDNSCTQNDPKRQRVHEIDSDTIVPNQPDLPEADTSSVCYGAVRQFRLPDLRRRIVRLMTFVVILAHCATHRQ